MTGPKDSTMAKNWKLTMAISSWASRRNGAAESPETPSIGHHNRVSNRIDFHSLGDYGAVRSWQKSSWISARLILMPPGGPGAILTDRRGMKFEKKLHSLHKRTSGSGITTVAPHMKMKIGNCFHKNDFYKWQLVDVASQQVAAGSIGPRF